MWGKLIFATSDATEGSLLVLLALGECADRERVARVSVCNLAKWCRLTDRQVQRCLRGLVEAGEIEQLAKGGGRGNPPSWKILLRWEKGVRFWPTKRVTLKKPLYAR